MQRLLTPTSGQSAFDEDEKEEQMLLPKEQREKRKKSPKMSGADARPQAKLPTGKKVGPSTACSATQSMNSSHYAGQVRGWYYDMCGHAEQCVERYCELANQKMTNIKEVATPCIDDHQLPPEDLVNKGTLDKVAARIVLKALYLARLGRPDILWTVNHLARKVTKWDAGCDKRTHRLISYLHKTKDWGQFCFVGDHPQHCWLALFCDASFAGDLDDSKSTSGAYLC